VTPDYDSTEGFVSIDFITRFPHKYWVSSWSVDDQYPAGFRYKLLSVRPEPEGLIELVVLLEEKSGAKIEMSRLSVSPSALDRTAATFTDGLAAEYKLQFSELDLTGVRSEADFERIVMAAGWRATSMQ
jgi:hypothetical protein